MTIRAKFEYAEWLEYHLFSGLGNVSYRATGELNRFPPTHISARSRTISSIAGFVYPCSQNCRCRTRLRALLVPPCSGESYISADPATIVLVGSLRMRQIRSVASCNIAAEMKGFGGKVAVGASSGDELPVGSDDT